MEYHQLWTWASADFLPEEGKVFQGGGVKKHTILADQGGGPGGKGPLLPSPADAHDCEYVS